LNGRGRAGADSAESGGEMEDRGIMSCKELLAAPVLGQPFLAFSVQGGDTQDHGTFRSGSSNRGDDDGTAW
jgi:hypothetical protein